MASLTALSKKALEKEGFVVERVEHFSFLTKRRVDLLGIGDLLALKPECLLLVQVTSKGHVYDRRKKARASEKLKLWLSAGGKFIIHGWSKEKNRWTLKTLNL